MDNPGKQFEDAAHEAVSGIKKEMMSRAYRVSNELRSISQKVLNGDRKGRYYRLPFTKKEYRASAPGEAPANRTGQFRMSWKMHPHSTDGGNTVHAQIESRLHVKGGQLLGDILEEGHGMKPRPYKQHILNQMKEKAKAIFNEPYTK